MCSNFTKYLNILNLGNPDSTKSNITSTTKSFFFVPYFHEEKRSLLVYK